jgi:carbon-monoxide dehydrogenase large subunit
MSSQLTSSNATAIREGLARGEDVRLLTGRGRYVHDVQVAGMLYGVFVRSMYARAAALQVDASAALDHEGVVAVLDGKQLAQCQMPQINPLLSVTQSSRGPLLAHAHISYVGQPIALVLATSLSAAHMAAELVMVDCETQDAQPDFPGTEAAVASVEFVHDSGDSRVGATAHTVHMVHSQPRLVAMSLEPRGAVAQWHADSDSLTVYLPTQAPSRARADIAKTLGMVLDKVHVVSPDVGGAFGAKASVTPEDLVVAWAARQLKTSIKWVASRSDEFTAGMHGRGAQLAGSLSLDSQGLFSQLEAKVQFPLGAWLPYSAVVPMRNATRILPGPYRVKQIDVQGQAFQSNAAAVNIYRGAGRPEAALLMERLVERAARAAKIDPVELRLRNLIAAQDMPYQTPTGETLDAGDYAQVLRQACEKLGYAAAREKQASRRMAGEVVGIGMAVYIEPCGQGWESARVTLQADGKVLVHSGSSGQGQGHETSFATIAAEVIGCATDQVTVVQGDTRTCPQGIGALASRSIAIGGSAIAQAAQQVIAKRDAGEALPLSADVVYTAPAEAWSYGCVMAQMVIDRETGKPNIERVVWADDAGRIISPQLAHGQLLGGMAQGLGQAMLERIVYDADGQLQTGSLMDYAVPRADDMPPVELMGLHCPTQANLLGAKGVGEAGCIGVPAALLNAAADALSPWGEAELDFPLTSERLWRVMSSQ